MACPYFFPTVRHGWSEWKGRFRPPLGEVFSGTCHACAGEQFEPSGGRLLESCNLGYARGDCERFPSGGAPDAVRFSIAADQEDVIHLSYVVERDHQPFHQGRLEYRRAAREWKGLDGSAAFKQQAGAYLQSYLRWKGRQQESGRAAASNG